MPAISHLYLGSFEFQTRLSELLRRVAQEYLCVHVSLRGQSVAVLIAESDCPFSDGPPASRRGLPGPSRKQRAVPAGVQEDPASARRAVRRGGILQNLERQAILDAVRQQKGNRRSVAKALGVGERTLYRKLRRIREDPNEK